MNFRRTIATILHLPAGTAQQAPSPELPAGPGDVVFVSRARQAGPSDPPPGFPAIPGDPQSAPIPHVALPPDPPSGATGADATTGKGQSPGQSLRADRMKRRVSLRTLSEASGIPVRMVARAENGTASPVIQARLLAALRLVPARAPKGAKVARETSPGHRTRMPFFQTLDVDEASQAQRTLKGTILRNLRQDRALTVAQVCAALRISSGHLRMLEAGDVDRHQPYDRAIALLASAFPFAGKTR
ncbi:MAG: hypothetical protein EBT09_00480 [Actinobacteria bacterium]|nr:hypothetical protein [Actinomycetota bacterium]